MTETLLEVDQVTHNYVGLLALDDVSISVARRDIKGLIGPNGAGKTTLLNIITGHLQPTSGSVRFLGEELVGKPPHLICGSGIGRTFQHVQLFPEMSVLDNLLVGQHLRSERSITDAIFGGSAYRRSEYELRTRADELLQMFGLIHTKNELAADLSHGEQRLIETLRALAADPDLLVLDEPAAGLTGPEIDRLADTLRAIRDGGTTVLLIDHNTSFVLGLCDTVAVLNFGKLLADGTAREIRQHPEVIRSYLGSDEGHDA